MIVLRLFYHHYYYHFIFYLTCAHDVFCHHFVITPGRSTCDCISTLNLIAQRRREFGHPTYAAYVDLRSAFDSISRPALWLLLSRLGIPGKIINLMKSLYDQSVSCVRANGLQSEWFKITSGVRQGCVIAPDSFATGVDWVMDRAVGKVVLLGLQGWGCVRPGCIHRSGLC